MKEYFKDESGEKKEIIERYHESCPEPEPIRDESRD